MAVQAPAFEAAEALCSWYRVSATLIIPAWIQSEQQHKDATLSSGTPTRKAAPSEISSEIYPLLQSWRRTVSEELTNMKWKRTCCHLRETVGKKGRARGRNTQLLLGHGCHMKQGLLPAPTSRKGNHAAAPMARITGEMLTQHFQISRREVLPKC